MNILIIIFYHVKQKRLTYALGRFLIISIMLLASVINAKAISESAIEGTWVVYNLRGQKSSIIDIYFLNNRLYARGLRVYKTYEGPINYLCRKCKGSLRNKPLWSGKYLPLSGFRRNNKSSNKWIDGKAISPKRELEFYPSIEFVSKDKAYITLRFLFFKVKARMKKIDKEGIYTGCKINVSQKDLNTWGDLDNKNNREKMLKDLDLSERSFMRKLNNSQACYSTNS